MALRGGGIMYRAGLVVSDGVIVTDNYEMGESPLIWVDAIVMPLIEYEALTHEEIHQIKLSRYQTWYDFVTKDDSELDLPEDVRE
jgi:hypothetical protein